MSKNSRISTLTGCIRLALLDLSSLAGQRCREKGGTHTAHFENVGNGAIIDGQPLSLRQSIGNLSGRQVRVLKFVADDFVFLCVGEPFRMGVYRMGFVSQSFDAIFSESCEIPVDGRKRHSRFLMDLLRGLFLIEDRSDSLIALGCIHRVASKKCGSGKQP